MAEKAKFESVDFAAYGLPEVRVMLEGGEYVTGFPPEQIDGKSLVDKVLAS